MITSKNNTQNSFKGLATGILALSTLTGLLVPATASASLVTGVATITIDNTAVIGSIPVGWSFTKYWGEADNTVLINGATAGGTSISSAGSTAMQFSVNTNAITTAYANDRTMQATTMDASNTSVGQIGLSGAMLLQDPALSTFLAPKDFDMVKTAGVWDIYTNDGSFGNPKLFTLANVSETLNGSGELLLSGDLMWGSTGYAWSAVTGADGSTVIGSFSLAPATVPVPAAVWLFGSGLVGLLATGRKKVKIT